jgi:para-aminobenzoate synthetase component 1
MSSAELASEPPRLPGVTSVHAERLELDEPFLEVVRRFAHLPGTVALMSGGEHDSARYHILGVYPWLLLSGHRTRTTLAVREDGGAPWESLSEGGRRVELSEDPFSALRRVLRHYRLPAVEAPSALSSGLLGYLAYDLKDCLERLPRTSIDDLGLPLLHLVAPSVIVVQDRVSQATTLFSTRREGEGARALADVARFKEALGSNAPRQREPLATGKSASNFSRAEYIGAVEAIRRYIVEGDVYQVNLSQRFEARFSGDPFDCFAAMYAANPAPFFAYIHAGDHRIVSTSPERFIELRGGHVEARPIKGTRRRGATPEEDRELSSELRGNEKEDAELSMIVDLLRNDIGKVCRAGSVRVAEHKRIEAYRNVYHLVSIVKGELDSGMDAVDLLRATFPGGSVTGCPKIRAMEIIDELEPVRRHVYTGSIGYLGFDGNLDLSIAIRTATFTGERVVFSVGGGVVYDSDPAAEFEETLHKGRTLMDALESASGAEAPSGIVWHDGAFKPNTWALLSLDSEGLAYGFGFFETLRVQAGRPILLDAHVQRFELAWREFFGGAPPDVTWSDVVAELVRKNGLSSGVAAVKLLAAAGKVRGSRVVPVLFASAKPYSPRAVLSLQPGLRLRSYLHPRHSPLASYKTLNYLYYKRAGDWARHRGADEALILNADRSVSETNTASVCCLFGSTACFPTSEHALPGTMAGEVRRLLPRLGFTVEERRLTVEELVAADQVLLMNSLMGVVPAVSLDDSKLRYDSELCERLNQAVFHGA